MQTTHTPEQFQKDFVACPENPTGKGRPVKTQQAREDR